MDREVQKEILESDIHDDALVQAAIEGIKSHDEYTPTNFESKQRTYIERLKPEMRKPARSYLPNRAAQIRKSQISNIVQPHPESSQLTKTERDNAVRVQLIIQTMNQQQSRGKTHEPERMVYIVHLLVYDLDRIFYESIAKKAVGSIPRD